MNDLLTDKEVEDITGAKQASKQAKVLSDNGIFYILRANGEVRVTWHHVHYPSKLSSVNVPDFDQVG